MNLEIQYKKWDSDFFGLKVGHISVGEDEFSDGTVQLNFENYDLIYIFSKCKLPNFSNELVDEKLVFEKELNNDYTFKHHISKVSEFTQNDYESLYDLALLSGKYSRYKLDANFSTDSFQKLYKTWLDNTLNNTFGFALFAAYFDNQIAGFITLNKKDETTAEIGLISVFEKFHGKGIAKDLINVASNYCLKEGFLKIKVATQRINNPATKLYLSMNFKLISTTFIYHIWK